MDDRSARFDDKIKNARRRSSTTSQSQPSSSVRRSSTGQPAGVSTTPATTKKPRDRRQSMDPDKIIAMLESHANTDSEETMERFQELKNSVQLTENNGGQRRRRSSTTSEKVSKSSFDDAAVVDC